MNFTYVYKSGISKKTGKPYFLIEIKFPNIDYTKSVFLDPSEVAMIQLMQGASSPESYVDTDTPV